MRGRSIKVCTTKSPNKVSNLPQQSALQFSTTPKNNLSCQSPQKQSLSRAVSIKNDAFPELDAASKLQRSRNMMDEVMGKLYGQVAQRLNEKENQQIVSMIKHLDQIAQFDEYLNQYFPCYNQLYAAKILQAERQVVKLSQDFKLKKKVLLSPEKDKQKNKKAQIQSLTEENLQLKKQLFRLKESSLRLQKRILQLVTEYKDRKMIYLSEIQKLATIVNTTIKNIPQMIMKDKLPTDRRTYSSQKTLLPPELTMTRKESEYNTLSTNDALRWGLENTYRVIDIQTPTSRKGANLQTTSNFTLREQ